MLTHFFPPFFLMLIFLTHNTGLKYLNDHPSNSSYCFRWIEEKTPFFKNKHKIKTNFFISL